MCGRREERDGTSVGVYMNVVASRQGQGAGGECGVVLWCHSLLTRFRFLSESAAWGRQKSRLGNKPIQIRPFPTESKNDGSASHLCGNTPLSSSKWNRPFGLCFAVFFLSLSTLISTVHLDAVHSFCTWDLHLRYLFGLTTIALTLLS